MNTISPDSLAGALGAPPVVVRGEVVPSAEVVALDVFSSAFVELPQPTRSDAEASAATAEAVNLYWSIFSSLHVDAASSRMQIFPRSRSFVLLLMFCGQLWADVLDRSIDNLPSSDLGGGWSRCLLQRLASTVFAGETDVVCPLSGGHRYLGEGSRDQTPAMHLSARALFVQTLAGETSRQ